MEEKTRAGSRLYILTANCKVLLTILRRDNTKVAIVRRS
jgi:hypothetical protein